MASASPLGRFPSNFLHDGSEEVLKEFAKAGTSKSNPSEYNWERSNDASIPAGCAGGTIKSGIHFADSGTPARFFYCAKASRAERNRGCEGLEKNDNLQGLDTRGRTLIREDGSRTLVERWKGKPSPNNHPTVKPLALMKYLVKLVSREGQVVLDPFAGSGTTCIAARELNRNYIGFELELQYVEIAKARLGLNTPKMNVKVVK
jgi:site-specific DNA-methyltransferase (adenine-specific)